MVPIPTNKPMIRGDQRDLIYRTEEAKFAAIVEDIAERHEKGQPVLIGTASVAKSEILSRLLKKAGVKHEVLNAKQHEREAAIIALAGAKGAVTVATNMAGRGTDIILGGNPEFLADKKLHDAGHRRRSSTPRSTRRCTRRSSKSSRSRSRTSTRRSSSSAACTSSVPSGTSPAGSTTSSAAVRAVRATRGRAGSICPSATT